MKQENQTLETPFLIKTYSKSQLAEMYGFTLKTLTRKVRFYNGNWPKGNLLIPKDVAAIVTLLGEPRSSFRG
jgi:hypothetical protein